MKWKCSQNLDLNPTCDENLFTPSVPHYASVAINVKSAMFMGKRVCNAFCPSKKIKGAARQCNVDGDIRCEHALIGKTDVQAIQRCSASTLRESFNVNRLLNVNVEG